MKVLFANTEKRGGAWIACKRFAEELQNQETEVSVLTADDLKDSAIFGRVKRMLIETNQRSKQAQWQSRNPDYPGVFTLESSAMANGLLDRSNGHDITHLHWVSYLLDWKQFFTQRDVSKPLFWTWHDQNPMSGGRHYEDKEEALFSSPSDPLEQEIWITKCELVSQSDNLWVITPSKWLANLAKQHPAWSKAEIRTIHNGVDTKLFSPGDVSIARQALDLPAKGTAFLFVADSLKDPRKGGDLLNAALEQLPDSDWFSISLGGSSPPTTRGNHFHLGHLSNERFLPLVYRAANALIVPSRVDNLPNTAVEAFACGVPVIAFNTGGLGDIIDDQTNGLLIDTLSDDALANALGGLINEPEMLSLWGANARAKALDEFDIAKQSTRYRQLYDEALEKA
ncbi:MAG: glycosyltransferase [Verrucomicrobiota bacterium]